MRRLAPRPLGRALDQVAADAAPAGPLAQLQARWEELAGSAVAAESRPVSEREGLVTVACESAVWAQELAFLAPDLRERANAMLGGEPVRELRFVVSRAGGS